MNLDGETYTELEEYRETYNDVLLGTVVSPEVAYNFTGFDSPQRQTVTLSTYEPVTIRYRYDRKRYNLVIENSEYVNYYNTPSGSYLYGTEIHLTASETNNSNNSFLKWSNNETNRDYTFTLTDNVTISPVYNNSYILTYVPDNGEPNTVVTRNTGQSINFFPSVTKELCTGSQGSYVERGCSEVYELSGWYLEPEFINKVDESYVLTGDTTVYAKWDKIYYSEPNPLVFNGDNYKDTGVMLFSEENIGKNFEVSFELSNVDSNQVSQATIFNSMQEISPYPGFVFRFESDTSKLEFNSPKIANKSKLNASATNKVVIKRVNDVYFLQINDGTEQRIGTYSGKTFEETAVLGASIDGNGNPMRYFKGTLSNIVISLADPEKYTIKFNANGGTGTMDDLIIRKDEPKALTSLNYEREGHLFDHWNTESDDSGTSYEDEEVVNNIGNPGETVTLYAQWVNPFKYYVRFNANGGTGTMDNQEFVYTVYQNLSTNQFTKEGYVLRGWNTSPDGSGTFYRNKQSLRNLTDVENDIIDLYAIWTKAEYEYNGEYIFDGNNYVDTGIYLFSEGMEDKYFDISFEIVSRDTTAFQSTMMSAMDETADPWPGVVYRVQDSKQDNIAANASKNAKADKKFNNSVSKVLIKKRGDNLYYSLDDGEDQLLLNMSSFVSPFDSPLVFGCSLTSSGTQQRNFKGTLKNLKVEVYE